MKKTTSIFMVFTFIVGIAFAQKEKKAEAEKINWLSFKEVTEQNKKKPKKIFIDTYTDWCGWCKRMDVTTFEDKEVVAIMNKYFYAIKFNAEGKDTILYNGKTYTNMNPTNARGTHQLAVELLNGKLGYPTSVYLDEQMKLLQPIPGYMDAKSFKQVLIYFAEDYNKKMSWEDFQQNYDELMQKKETKPEKKSLSLSEQTFQLKFETSEKFLAQNFTLKKIKEATQPSYEIVKQGDTEWKFKDDSKSWEALMFVQFDKATKKVQEIQFTSQIDRVFELTDELKNKLGYKFIGTEGQMDIYENSSKKLGAKIVPAEFLGKGIVLCRLYKL